MIFTFPQVSQMLLDFRYFILFPLVVIEGPIITILAGFFMSLGNLNFFITYPLVIAGDLGGDIIYYFLGRLRNGKFAVRWGRHFGITEKRVEQLETHFRNNGGRTLLIGKLSHGIGAAFLVAAGIAKMPFWRFIWYNFLGTAPKSILLLAVGYYYGNAITKIKTVLDLLALVFVTAGLALSGWYYFYYRRRNKK